MNASAAAILHDATSGDRLIVARNITCGGKGKKVMELPAKRTFC
jgi:hypothetical protein